MVNRFHYILPALLVIPAKAGIQAFKMLDSASHFACTDKKVIETKFLMKGLNNACKEIFFYF